MKMIPRAFRGLGLTVRRSPECFDGMENAKALRDMQNAAVLVSDGESVLEDRRSIKRFRSLANGDRKQPQKLQRGRHPGQA